MSEDAKLSPIGVFEPVKIPLQFPIDNGEKGLIEEIVISKEPEWGDTIHINDKAPLEGMLILASKLSGIPSPILKKIKQKDANRIMEALSSFL